MQNQQSTSEIGQISAAELTPLVNEALKSCHSVLALSRSPLANSSLVSPALVRDNVSPTAAERAHALRLVLQWAVNRLAPNPNAHPFGQHRPFDDPTWRDSRWWRYNILRHRYLEPLHPDDFVAAGRFTETIVALTGIPSTDTFFAERNRAISEVARWLHRQLQDGEADLTLEQLAVQEVYLPLRRETTALQLLGIASVFDRVFPRSLLRKLAKAEGIMGTGQALKLLVQQRYLLSGDDDDNLWLSPVLRNNVYAQQRNAVTRSRHERIARYYANTNAKEHDASLLAAHHFLEAGRTAHATQVLLDAAQELVKELEIDELRVLLPRIRRDQLSDERWCAVQLLLADLHHMGGDHEAAVTACRAALKSTTERRLQAQVYRRLGKLYEQRNQHHAINYYGQAIERFDPSDPAMAKLLKDRGWLYILRRDRVRANVDLTSALRHASEQNQAMMADIFDALSGLCRRQANFEPAIDYARTALVMREEVGNPLHIAKSLGNLGLIYHAQGAYDNAIAAHREAFITYEKLNNRALMLAALLNIGSAQHLAGQLREAVQSYRVCIDIGLESEHTYGQITAHSNLAEAYAQLGEDEAARHHWHTGHALSRQHGFDDQVTYFAELREQFPALQTINDELVAVPPSAADTPPVITAAPNMPTGLDPDQQIAWRIAQTDGTITAKSLMEHAVVSKATATRKLGDLAGRGLLRKEGKGRGTHYVINREMAVTSSDPATRQKPLMARVRQQLGERQTRLSEQYDLAALGVIGPSPHTRAMIPGALNMVARFGQLPDVLTFFDLENYLTEVSGQHANLILEEAMSTEERGSVISETTWIWG